MKVKIKRTARAASCTSAAMMYSLIKSCSALICTIVFLFMLVPRLNVVYGEDQSNAYAVELLMSIGQENTTVENICDGERGYVVCTDGTVTQIFLENSSSMVNYTDATLPDHATGDFASFDYESMSISEISCNNCLALGGTFPAVWGRMTSLTKIQFISTSLTGTLPSEWGALMKMQVLNLSHNQLSGTLPGEWSTMTNLQELRFELNKLDGALPTEWSNLTALETLGLGYNSFIGGIPSEWSAIASLQAIYAAGAFTNGTLPSVLPQNIQILDLSRNHLTSTIPSSYVATNYTNLQLLNLTGNCLTGEMPASWELSDDPLHQTYVDLKYEMDNYLMCGQCSGNDVCPVCDIANCDSCSTDNVCEACNSGFVFSADGKSCITCQVSNCDTCSSDNVCATCKYSFSFATDGFTCIKCGVPNCDKCYPNGICDSCIKGYALVNDECAPRSGGYTDDSSKSKIPWWVWLIIGILAAGVAAVIIFVIFWCCCCKKSTLYESSDDDVEEKENTEDDDSRNFSTPRRTFSDETYQYDSAEPDEPESSHTFNLKDSSTSSSSDEISESSESDEETSEDDDSST